MWRTFLAPSFLLPATNSTGLCINSLEISAISFGMVAENMSIFLSPGTCVRISRMSSRNPMLSISSASSRMTVCTSSSFTSPRLIRSIRRPGVATTTCTPLRSVRIWLSMLEPPYTGRIFRLSIYFEKSAKSPAICRQSSLVGAIIRACGTRRLKSTRCSTGRPNAAVFPVPVCARPTTSPSFERRCGITIS